MSVLEEEPKLNFHRVSGTAVDDLSLASVALGVVLQELHDLRTHGLVHTAWHANIQKDLQSTCNTP